MNFSQRFNQKGLSDVTLRLRTVEAPVQKGRLTNRARTADPPIERSFYLHKVILFQSPYFEDLHKWSRDEAVTVTSLGSLT